MVVILFVLLPWVASGQTFIFDEFNNLNTSNWVTSTFDGGTVYVDGGLHLIDRGRVTTNPVNYTFDQPFLTIGGTITFNSADDIFNVVFRSNGNYGGTSGEATDGLKLYFGPYAGGIFGLDEISLLGTTSLLNSTYPGGIESETAYDFILAVVGPSISFSLGPAGLDSFGEFLDVPTFLGTSSASYGSRVGFYNREFTDQSHTAVISFLAVEGIAIPEPGTTGILFGAAGLAGAWLLRRRRVAARSI